MLVLASASKARKKLLEQICLKHKVIVSDFDETKVVEQDPCLKVKLLIIHSLVMCFYWQLYRSKLMTHFLLVTNVFP